MTHSSDETSYLVRVSSGSFSMRTNIVGTTWLWVMSYWSTSGRYSSASKCSIATMRGADAACRHAEPQRGGVVERRGERYALGVVHPEQQLQACRRRRCALLERLVREGRETPLGSPVVPDEYSMSVPATRFVSGSARLRGDAFS